MELIYDINAFKEAVETIAVSCQEEKGNRPCLQTIYLIAKPYGETVLRVTDSAIYAEKTLTVIGGGNGTSNDICLAFNAYDLIRKLKAFVPARVSYGEIRLSYDENHIPENKWDHGQVKADVLGNEIIIPLEDNSLGLADCLKTCSDRANDKEFDFDITLSAAMLKKLLAMAKNGSVTLKGKNSQFNLNKFLAKPIQYIARECDKKRPIKYTRGVVMPCIAHD